MFRGCGHGPPPPAYGVFTVRFDRGNPEGVKPDDGEYLLKVQPDGTVRLELNTSKKREKYKAQDVNCLPHGNFSGLGTQEGLANAVAWKGKWTQNSLDPCET